MKRYNYKRRQAIRIFVVEDEPMYCKMVKYTMELNPDHEVYVFETGQACIEQLHLNPTIVSIDYSLPDMNGEELLKKIHNYDKNIRVIVLSGQGDIATAINLLRQGASDYLTKDNETQERLLNSVNLLKENSSLIEEVSQLKEELSEKYQFGNMLIGTSDAMKHIFNLLERAVENEITVSITGETGTGKEVVAKTIHYNSSRKKAKFVAVNMSAIPRDLLESELFGHEKGAFTGAIARKQGKFELADKGTLFLDEIGDMDISLQAKLLRAIQEREIVRVGGAEPVKFNARIIVATHKNLAEEVQKGNFREDLYYRILGLPIELPPLKEREGDILILAQYFLENFKKANPKRNTLQLSSEAKNKLMNYNYPGNVRELKSIIELAAVLTVGKRIEGSSIQFRSPQKTMDLLDGELTIKEYVNKIVYHYLKKYRNVMVVAKKLDIGKSTIYKMLKEDRELSELVKKY
ncbi:sigma-54-dependent transcriptional regulator [Aureispira anguillae]|uniref:Sigma-54 dependent transcriptional regulator n=1 Tax=Aureispira anguillae TaxID=2864201 RepID=A0A915YLQ4_9BACT|nr:sigma-54 dependent transcriptional regulator [Aureispira anguillae]BDS15538.1 sigma-54 dependent transcriptional regulator [Aureispira anguillae]